MKPILPLIGAGTLAVALLCVLTADDRGHEAAVSSVLPSVSSPPPARTVAAYDAIAVHVSADVQRVRAFFVQRHCSFSDADLLALATVVVDEAERHSLDLELVLAVIAVESRGYYLAVSPVGALGLMQILPSTGEELAAQTGIPWVGPDTLFDPIANVQLGTTYLSKLIDRYGDVHTALAAYNWGPGNIDRRLRDGVELPKHYPSLVMKARRERLAGSS